MILNSGMYFPIKYSPCLIKKMLTLFRYLRNNQVLTRTIYYFVFTVTPYKWGLAICLRSRIERIFLGQLVRPIPSRLCLQRHTYGRLGSEQALKIEGICYGTLRVRNLLESLTPLLDVDEKSENTKKRIF
ncbi:hypothetical protein PoB_004882900 [Plakobranchus ocellatus]|uniref:Uncharacterized protein n=1 Tax=Plakobranchus ocellatus TaxID=259542 RepID=A0AAV4BQB1_9GAST|nr:hypothetical protein PoB_004882900 [Plakobranchus ocellatus]